MTRTSVGLALCSDILAESLTMGLFSKVQLQ